MRVLFCLFLISALVSGSILNTQVHATGDLSSSTNALVVDQAINGSGASGAGSIGCAEVASASSKPTAIKPPQSYSTKSFWVESNSTIKALSFNNKTLQLRLTVFGENGTTGYVKVRILKHVLPNPDLVKVTLDGHKIDFTLESNPSNWFMKISYTHSEHQIKVSLGKEAPDGFLGVSRLVWISSIIATIFCVTVAVYMVMWLAKRNLPSQAVGS
jgi:hypothetical protein